MQRNFPSRFFLPGLLAVALAGPFAPAPVTAAESSFSGSPVALGRGTARTVVRTDASGEVTSVAIVLTAKALDGLPGADRRGGHAAYVLPMPKQGPKTVIDHVVLNWEAAGHPPPGVYDVPHFDFHFYLIAPAARTKIAFAGPGDSASPAQQPPAELLPAGYVVPPGTAVPQMGVHAVDPGGAEFKGQPFTSTFIYGYHERALTFLEPMASLQFLKSKPDFSAAIPRPAAYSKPGRYPSSYRVRFDAAKKVYEIALGDWR